MTELGYLFTEDGVVPRDLLEVIGVKLRGDLLGLQYACFPCQAFHLKSIWAETPAASNS